MRSFDRVHAAVALAIFLGKDEFELRTIVVGIDETRRFDAARFAAVDLQHAIFSRPDIENVCAFHRELDG